MPILAGESAFIATKTTTVSKATVASFPTTFSLLTSVCNSARYIISFLMLAMVESLISPGHTIIVLSSFAAKFEVIFGTFVAFQHISSDLFIRVPSRSTFFQSLISSRVSYNKFWLVYSRILFQFT